MVYYRQQNPDRNTSNQDQYYALGYWRRRYPTDQQYYNYFNSNVYIPGKGLCTGWVDARGTVGQGVRYNCSQ